MYTKGACVVFLWFRNFSKKIFYEIQSVVSIKDQREYEIWNENIKFCTKMYMGSTCKVVELIATINENLIHLT